MEEHLYSLISGAVSFTVAWGSMGEGVSLPRAAIHRVSGLRHMHLKGVSLMEGRVQIDCYGATYAQAISASRDVRTTLEGYTGGPIQGAFLENTSDAQDDDAQILQRVRMTFLVFYTE